MKFTETPLPGAYLVEMEPSQDKRGFFGRAFSATEFRGQGLDAELTEISICHNAIAGTLRGMHYQHAPHSETKFIRAIQGAIFDVIVDVRPASPTFKKWFGWNLTSASGAALYVPKGFAHGFVTLEDRTDVLYQISDTYNTQASTGFAWNDPSVAIEWPAVPAVISSRDAALPLFADTAPDSKGHIF